MNETDVLSSDCARCGSAGSIEFGMCQVCLTPPTAHLVSYLTPPASIGETPAAFLSAG